MSGSLCLQVVMLIAPFIWAKDANSAVDQFGDLLKAQVGVQVEPLSVLLYDRNDTITNATCQLTLHRDNCVNGMIGESETISWNTRICFKWTCDNTEDHVMRVQECWTGSRANPIYLIDERGCSKERTMISTPKYEKDLLTAYAVGWLTVRLVGAPRIRLSCAVRLCHLCDPDCPAFTPPKSCHDPDRLFRYAFTRWNDTDLQEQSCPTEQSVTAQSGSSALSFNILPFIFQISFALTFRSRL